MKLQSDYHVGRVQGVGSKIARRKIGIYKTNPNLKLFINKMLRKKRLKSNPLTQKHHFADDFVIGH